MYCVANSRYYVSGAVLKLFAIAPEGRLSLAQDAVRSTKSWDLPPNLTQPREGRLIFSQGETLGRAPLNNQHLAPCPSIATTLAKTAPTYKRPSA